MNRIRNIAAVVLGAALAAGAAGTAGAQATDTTPQHPSDKAAGTAPKEQMQEKLDREKVTIKDRVQDAITTADSNVDALKKVQDSDKGANKQRDKDMEKKLSDLKDNLSKDLDKIDKATSSDWSSVHATVIKDLNSMEQQLKVASTITHVPLPTGAANKQPEGKTNKQPAPKPAPEKTP